MGCGTHVGDGAQHADRVGAKEVVGRIHVLGKRRGHNDNAVGVRLELLDHEVHQTPQLFVL